MATIILASHGEFAQGLKQTANVFGVFGFAAEVVEPVFVFAEVPPLTINCCPG
nr:hypothetical protein [Enterococcus faecium]